MHVRAVHCSCPGVTVRQTIQPCIAAWREHEPACGKGFLDIQVAHCSTSWSCRQEQGALRWQMEHTAQ